MNTIIKFPIRVNNTKATEAVEGLCPTLCADVGSFAYATSANVVSEHGLRLALSGHVLNVYGKETVPDGFSLFHSATADDMYFNTIQGYTANDVFLSGSNIVVTEDDDTIFLDVRSDVDLVIDKTAFRIKRTVNGGTYQEACHILAGSIPASGLEIFNDVDADDVIGKIFLEGLTELSANIIFRNSIYSIGTTGNLQGFVKQFHPPASGEMLDVDYGEFMYDKKQETDTAHLVQSAGGLVPYYSPDIAAPIKEREAIRIFRYGDIPLSGEMRCVIFYDKRAGLGLIIGGSPVGTESLIQRYAIYNETSSFSMLSVPNRPIYVGVVNGKTDSWIIGGHETVSLTYLRKGYRIRHADLTMFASSSDLLTTARSGCDCESSDKYGYTAGGSSSLSTTLSDIERFDMTANVPASLFRVKMNSKRTHHTMIFNWPVYNFGYIFGGVDSEIGTVPSQVVDKYYVLNDTVASLPRTSWITPGNLSGKSVDEKNMWLVRGSITGLSDMSPGSKNIFKMSLSDETMSLVTNTNLVGNQVACVQDNTHGVIWMASDSNAKVERFMPSNGTTVVMTGILTSSDYGICGKGALV